MRKGEHWRTLITIFGVAVLANYVWELGQAPLYVGMDSFRVALWHCFIASIGDGLLVLLILALGWVTFGRPDWFVRPGMRGYLLMVLAGFVISVSVELIALRTMRGWIYTPRMPLVPVAGVGLAPVMQMLVLPPLIFRLSSRKGIKSSVI